MEERRTCDHNDFCAQQWLETWQIFCVVFLHPSHLVHVSIEKNALDADWPSLTILCEISGHSGTLLPSSRQLEFLQIRIRIPQYRSYSIALGRYLERFCWIFIGHFWSGILSPCWFKMMSSFQGKYCSWGLTVRSTGRKISFSIPYYWCDHQNRQNYRVAGIW